MKVLPSLKIFFGKTFAIPGKIVKLFSRVAFVIYGSWALLFSGTGFDDSEKYCKTNLQDETIF